jgi:hypothetical protein
MSVSEWLQAELKLLKEDAKIWRKWAETGIRPKSNDRMARHSAKRPKKKA